MGEEVTVRKVWPISAPFYDLEQIPGDSNDLDLKSNILCAFETG